MSKKLLLALVITGCFLFGPFASFAQEGGDYIVHTVKSGEVPSVLAKKYNVTLADLISLNKWGTTRVILHVGDKVKLPIGAHLSPVNDSSAKAAVVAKAPIVAPPPVLSTPEGGLEGKAPAKQATKPADTGRFTIHIIQHGEIPSALAKKYNINVDELKELNNWTPKTVWHVGDKVKMPRSAHSVENADSVKTVAPAVPKPVTPVVAVNKQAVDTAVKAVTVAAPANQINYVVQKKETLYSISKKFNVSVAHLKDWNRLVEDKISEGQTLVIYTDKPATQPAPDKKNAPGVPVKEGPVTVAPQQTAENKPVVEAVPQTTIVSAKPSVDPATASIPDEGYFTTSFGKDIEGKSLKSVSGVAMVMTSNGSANKKYYVLMNDAPPETIVKISNADGKSVYAKILWKLSADWENQGLSFMISDAAASALGFKDSKFPITVSYYH